MWRPTLFFAASLAGYVASQPTHTARMIPHHQLTSKSISGPSTLLTDSSTHADTRHLAVARPQNLFGMSELWTDGETKTIITRIAGTRASIGLTITSATPLSGAATIDCTPCNGLMTIAFRQEGTNLIESVSYEGREFTTVDRLLMPTPRTLPSVVTVLKMQDELSTLDDPATANPDIVTIYSTVTVKYGDILTPTQATEITTIPDADMGVVKTIVFGPSTTLTLGAPEAFSVHDGSITKIAWAGKSTTIDLVAVETTMTSTIATAHETRFRTTSTIIPADVTTIAKTVFVKPEEVLDDPSTNSSTTADPTATSWFGKYIRPIFTPSSWFRSNIFWGLFFWGMLSLCALLFLSKLYNKFRYNNDTNPPQDLTDVPRKAPPAQHRHPWSVMTNFGNTRNGSGQNTHTYPDGRGTVSRRAEEGRGPIGQPVIVEEVISNGPGRPNTVVEEIRVPMSAHQLDGVVGTNTGSRPTDTGSLRDRRQSTS